MAKHRGWLVLTTLFIGAGAGSCIRDGAPAGSIETRTSALLAPIQNDFEDGTAQGWIPRGPVTLTNTTEAAFNGTRSLKTTGRTAGFHGPSLSLTSQLAQGATYQVGVSVRLVSGSAPTTIRVTMQRTLPGGANQFDTIAQNTNVTDAAWTTFNAPYTFSTDVTGLLLYVEATDPTVSYYIDAFSLTESAPPPLSSDFEDGTNQGWIPRGPVTLTNTTAQAFAGTRSLLTTGRTAGFHGPSLPLTAALTKGATYGVTVSARLLAGTPATTLRVTMQRTLPGGANQFDSIAQNTNVTDAAWVTMTGLYTFTTDVTGLLLYVESTSATASYYIDSFSIVQLAPPPGPPANTAGAAATFESGTLEGWASRTGGEIVANTTADAHTGTRSLLTTNRTATFQGPAFNVTNVMFNGSRYRIEVWAKLAPGQASTQLRVSLQRNLGTFQTTFHTVVPNTIVTSDAWVMLAATFDNTLANTSLTLYVETASGNQSFYIDDFKITFIPPPVAELDIPSVYQTMAPFFPVGSAVRAADLSGQSAVLLTKHFNSITSENDMKWDATEGTEGVFTFANADAQVNFAKANNMRVWGHTLVWHNQTPAWVFNDANGNPMTPTAANRTLLIQRMRNHIQGVVTHFGTDVGTWDVVNEAIDPSQSDGYRRSPWFNIIGPEYIDIAFQAAHEFAPAAKLYYNDFGTTDTTKLAFIAALVSGMKSRGVPIDGVGHQMHNNVDFPSGAAVTNALDTIHALGVENAVTELDVSIYSGSFNTSVPDYTNIPPERFVLQGYRYRTFFEAFKQAALAGKLKSVTTWGKSDAQTWLTSAGRVDGPLLFDISFKKKLAYWGVIDPLQLPGADLSTTLAAAPMTVPAGEAIVYTITVRNNADTDTASFKPTDDDLPAANVSLSTAIPAHTTFQSLAMPAGWTCATPASGGTGAVQCSIAALPAGGSAVFTLTVTLADCSAPNGSAITASANVTSTTADPNPAPNNTSSASVQVSNPPPELSVVAPIVLAAPNHLYQSYTIADLVTAASDSCGSDVGIADVVITKVTSDEVVNGCGDGDTLDDIAIGADCRSTQLRVERSGCGNGRVYTVFVHVEDLAGNRTAASVKVLVPANASGTTAVDDGPQYTLASSCP